MPCLQELPGNLHPFLMCNTIAIEKGWHDLKQALEKLHTPPPIMKYIQQCLKGQHLNTITSTCQLSYLHNVAICDQNWIGWDNLLCGYLSTSWNSFYEEFNSHHQLQSTIPTLKWSVQTIKAL